MLVVAINCSFSAAPLPLVLSGGFIIVGFLMRSLLLSASSRYVELYCSKQLQRVQAIDLIFLFQPFPPVDDMGREMYMCIIHG